MDIDPGGQGTNPVSQQSAKAAAQPGGPGTSTQLDELRMSEVRHPTEPSRFALALVSMAAVLALGIFVLVSLGEITFLIAMLLVFVVVILLVWLFLQVWRVRLLGDAVLVSAETFPGVQDALDSVKRRLGYTRRVDLFVVDNMSRVLSADVAPIALTTYFGVHVLVIEGRAIGDLREEVDRRRLMFLLATYIGALKARYAQYWSPLFTAFQMTGLTSLVLPLVLPYYRATVYSGDRVAYACCGDLDVSLQAVYRALVGSEAADSLRPEGLVHQALAVRRRPLLRFAQLLRSTPHATNRYLELLAFVRQRSPDQFDGHRAAVGRFGEELEPVLVALGARRPHLNAPAVGVALSAVVLAAGLVTGINARDSVFAQSLYALYLDATGTDVSPVDVPDDPEVSQPAEPVEPAEPGTISPPSGEVHLTFEVADVSYDCLLFLDGDYGIADVAFIDPVTGGYVEVREDLNLIEVQTGYAYIGSNPRDPSSDVPIDSYSPDAFGLMPTADGWVFTQTCDAAGYCADLSVIP